MIKVRLNNEELTLYQSGTVNDLTESLNIKGICSLIQVNNREISQDRYNQTWLRDGDYIDITINYGKCKTLRQI